MSRSVLQLVKANPVLLIHWPPLQRQNLTSQLVEASSEFPIYDRYGQARDSVVLGDFARILCGYGELLHRIESAYLFRHVRYIMRRYGSGLEVDLDPRIVEDITHWDSFEEEEARRRAKTPPPIRDPREDDLPF